MDSRLDLFVQTMGPSDAPISLLFMHGPGLDHTCFLPFVEPLADDYRLILYDARLCGRSTRDADVPVDLDRLAEDVVDVVARYAGDSAVVAVAHSWAPLVALEAARRHDSPLAGLILVCPGLSLTIGDALMRHAAANGTPAQRQVLADAFAGRITEDADLRRVWRSILPLYLTSHNEWIAEELLGNVRFSANAFNSFAANVFGRLDWREVVPRLEMPTLVVAGAHDWVETDAAGGSPAVARASPRATLHLMNGSAHFPWAEELLEFRSTTHNWIVQNRSAISRSTL